MVSHYTLHYSIKKLYSDTISHILPYILHGKIMYQCFCHTIFATSKYCTQGSKFPCITYYLYNIVANFFQLKKFKHQNCRENFSLLIKMRCSSAITRWNYSSIIKSTIMIYNILKLILRYFNKVITYSSRS